MEPNKDLTPQEEQNLNEQLRIASREAEIRENMGILPGAPAGLADEFMKSIIDFETRFAEQSVGTVGDYLKEHEFQDAEKLTEEEAENAINSLLNVLAESRIFIDDPQMTSAKDYYRWLCEDFVKQEITMPLGDGWNMNFLYNELVPDGPDAMNFTVTTCLEDLFRLDSQSNPWTFEDQLITKEEGDGPTEVQPALTRYITAWREAIDSVTEYRYTPVAGVRVGENLGDFTFNIAYTVIREDGRMEEFNGAGAARLVYDGCYWSIRNICFPSFEMPTLGLS